MPPFLREDGQGFINVFHNSMFTKTSLHNMFVNDGFSPVVVSYSIYDPEVWGIARKVEGTPLPVLKRENPYLVRYGVHWSPALFEQLYHLIRVIAHLTSPLRRSFRANLAPGGRK